MPVAILELLLGLVADYGADIVLRWLVEAGIVPPWVIGGANGAIESEPGAIESYAELTFNEVTHSGHGLEKIYQAAHAAQQDTTAIANALANISTAIANLPVPPTGGQNASEVWNAYVQEGDPYTAGEHLAYLENFAANVGQMAAFVLQGDPFLVVEAWWKYPPD